MKYLTRNNLGAFILYFGGVLYLFLSTSMHIINVHLSIYIYTYMYIYDQVAYLDYITAMTDSLSNTKRLLPPSSFSQPWYVMITTIKILLPVMQAFHNCGLFGVHQKLNDCQQFWSDDSGIEWSAIVTELLTFHPSKSQLVVEKPIPWAMSMWSPKCCVER